MATVIGFDKNEKHTFTCGGNAYKPGCGAVVVYNQHDIHYYSGKDYSGGPDGMEWVDCPNCSKRYILRSW